MLLKLKNLKPLERKAKQYAAPHSVIESMRRVFVENHTPNSESPIDAEFLRLVDAVRAKPFAFDQFIGSAARGGTLVLFLEYLLLTGQYVDLYEPELAKIATALNAKELKDDMQRRWLKRYHPKAFAQIMDSVRKTRHSIRKISPSDQLKEALGSLGIRGHIAFREKSFFSIWNKVGNKSSLPADLFGFRIIVERRKDCFALLRHLREKFMIKQEKDYITKPKENGYQSIHLVISINGIDLEVQIRTGEMHHEAEYGTASHSLYKYEDLAQWKQLPIFSDEMWAETNSLAE